MAIPAIIGIILFIVLVVLIIKLIKNTIKAIIIIISILLILLIIGTCFVYSDVNDFKQNFPTIPSLYLLEKNDQIVAGIYGIFSEEELPSLASEEQLTSYQNSFQENDLEEIKGDYYKVFIINSNAFDSITEIKTADITLSKETIFNFLDSSTPVDDFLALKNIPREQRDEALASLNVKNDAEFKSLLFTLLFGTLIQEQGPLFIFTQYKQGNIIIYPKTTIFMLIKKVPSSLLNKLLLKITQGE